MGARGDTRPAAWPYAADEAQGLRTVTQCQLPAVLGAGEWSASDEAHAAHCAIRGGTDRNVLVNRAAVRRHEGLSVEDISHPKWRGTIGCSPEHGLGRGNSGRPDGRKLAVAMDRGGTNILADKACLRHTHDGCDTPRAVSAGRQRRRTTPPCMTAPPASPPHNLPQPRTESNALAALAASTRTKHDAPSPAGQRQSPASWKRIQLASAVTTRAHAAAKRRISSISLLWGDGGKLRHVFPRNWCATSGPGERGLSKFYSTRCRNESIPYLARLGFTRRACSSGIVASRGIFNC